MLRITLFTIVAFFAISCNQPKIEVTPITNSTTVGDSILFTINAKHYERITASVDNVELLTFTDNTYDPPYFIRFDQPGQYSIYWHAESTSGSRYRAASVYTDITVTD